MAGTVEHLQLGVEEDDLYRVKGMGERLIRRMVFLTPSRSWSEAEERRRVFWAVFLMDRFCSVSTGWKISLRNADVKRRLPCEGALWEKEQEVCTPYFGISDIKNTTLSNSHSATVDGCEEQAIGAFAYIIEATESLALVTNFYLHHAFLINDASKARLWLVKFKELDLRLIQHNRVPPSPALNTLIANLMEISQRWTRQHDGSQAHQEDSLAFKFATRLTEAQQNRACVSRPSLDIRTTAYSDESKEEMYKDLVGTNSDNPPDYESLGGPLQLAPFPSQQSTGCSFDPFSLAFPPLPPAFQQDFSPTGLDPFSFYNMQLPSDPSISSPLETRSHESGSRHDSESSMTILMPTDISHLFDVTSSPGQRISYYGNTRGLTKDSATDGIED
ncbi:hypothetical protein AtubIFM57258_003152 [Aspergillus tubingensis]|nr:hypothetical protein AtubIFM57258_003152 [Aspergillus tubingensis]